jgi:hypothetical protein
MTLTLHSLLLLIAAIVFLIAALPVAVGKVNLMAAGLFLLTLSFIFP